MADTINITAKVQRGTRVYDVEGKIEGLTATVLTVTITKVMVGSQDVTAFWQDFEDANDFEEAIKKAYVKQEVDASIAGLIALKNRINEDIDSSVAKFENARRLLLNY